MLHLCFSLKTQQQRPVQRKTQQVPSAPECQQALGAGKLRSHHLWCWQEAISEGNSLKPVLDSNPQREREILGRRCLCGCLGTWSQLKKRQVLACRTGAGFLLPFWVDKGLLTPHFKDLAYHTAFEPTQISKTEEETLEGCCSPQSTSACTISFSCRWHQSLEDVFVLCGAVASPISSSASSCPKPHHWCFILLVRSLSQPGTGRSRAEQSWQPLGASCAHLLSRGWGLLLLCWIGSTFWEIPAEVLMSHLTSD